MNWPTWEWLFWTAGLLLAYAYGGYQVVLLLLARTKKRRGVPQLMALPNVTLIVPAYNEERVIRQKLENCRAIDYPRDKLEILVASDGSSDATVSIVRSFDLPNMRLLDFEVRRGKASIVNDAARQARGEVLCLCDANVMFEPGALRRLVGWLADPEVGAASGDVRLASHESNFGEGESLYYRLERSLQTAESRVGSLMGVDGGMYVVRHELFRPLPADTILDDFVLSMGVIQQGYRVVYDPDAVATENGTPEARQEFRRRVRVSAGGVQVLLRGNFPAWWQVVPLWQFVSHKLLRWIAPALLVSLLVSSAMLQNAGAFYRVAFLGQGTVYLAALLGLLSIRFRETRWGGVPFYFVLSNIGIAAGWARGALGLQQVTWAKAERSKQRL